MPAMKYCLSAAAAAVMALAASGASAAEHTVLGTLTCTKSGQGSTYLIHSKIPVDCVYEGVGDKSEYVGTTGILLGADLEIEDESVFTYVVVGATGADRDGLAGEYVGAKASATFGLGLAAQGGLVGASEHSFEIVPLGVGAQVGIGATGGIGYLDIHAKPAPVAQQVVVPPPPHTPPPPKVVAVPTPHHYTAFFEFDSSKLTPGAASIVDKAAQDFTATHPSRIVVDGNTDTMGSDAYNDRLGLRRAEAVKAELILKGVPPASISISSSGKHRLLVPTPDHVREPQNRRVEIVIP